MSRMASSAIKPEIQPVPVTLPSGAKKLVSNNPVTCLLTGIGRPEIYRARGRKDGALAEIRQNDLRSLWDNVTYITPVLETPEQLQEAFSRAGGLPVKIVEQPVKNAIHMTMRALGL